MAALDIGVPASLTRTASAEASQWRESNNQVNGVPLGIVEQLIVGRDGIVRGAKMKTGKSFIERAVQQLYPLELSCDRSPPPTANLPPLNHDAPVLRPYAHFTYTDFSYESLRIANS